MRFRLNDKQLEHLRPYVKDSSILDLGAADLEGAQLMLELGARDVLAVDRFEMPRPSISRITTKQVQFQHLEETRPVVLASWIVNWQVDIEKFLETADVVISISKNTDGSACGYRGMWQHLRRREVLLYLADPTNCLTVYGPKKVELTERPPTGEEVAALWPDPMKMWSFEEAEARANKKTHQMQLAGLC